MGEPDKRALRQKIMGTLLSHARVRAGRSQAEVATALHVSRPRYAAYERGQQDLSLPELETVAQLCGVPLGYFFDDKASAEDTAVESPILLRARVRRKAVGALLRMARLTAGRTTEQCANLLGVSARRVNQYENGDMEIPLTELAALASYVNAPTDRLHI